MGLSEEQKNTLSSLLDYEFNAKLGRFKVSKGLDNSFAAKNCIPVRDRRIFSTAHSLSTSFGQSFFEKIAVSIAKCNSDVAETQWKSNIKISRDRLAKIDEISAEIGTGARVPNIDQESSEILSISNNNQINDVDGQIVDVYFKRGHEEYYVDIKTAKPNLPGFISLKKNNLKWIARSDKKINPILAIPYNPFAPNPYNAIGHERLERGKELLVGKEFWDLVGGDGCYEDLDNVFKDIGDKYWPRFLEKAGVQNE